MHNLARSDERGLQRSNADARAGALGRSEAEAGVVRRAGANVDADGAPALRRVNIAAGAVERHDEAIRVDGVGVARDQGPLAVLKLGTERGRTV